MSVTEREVVTPIEIAEPNDAQRVLLEARSLIADESKWCTEYIDHQGRYCAIGAMSQFVDHVCDLGEYDAVAASPAGRFLIRAADDALAAHPEIDRCRLPELWPADVNDGLGHRATMEMFDRAIALAGEQS